MAKDHPTGNSGLYRAFLQLKTPEECYRFLQDVCSYSELSAMEQRYNIAELLADKRAAGPKKKTAAKKTVAKKAPAKKAASAASTSGSGSAEQ